MPVRMMLYIAALYEQLLKTNPQAGLPPVLPIVLYNGDNKWTAKTSIQDLMPTYPQALAPYQPQCTYLLIDENSYAQHELERVRRLAKDNNLLTAFTISRDWTVTHLYLGKPHGKVF